MYCKYCGAEIDNDSAFCPNCGHDLTSIGTTKTQAVNTNDLIILEAITKIIKMFDHLPWSIIAE